MKAFLDDRQSVHHPKFAMANGRPIPNREVPERIGILRAGAEAAGARFAAPPDAGQGPISAIHTSEYLVFLETIHARWQRMPDAGDEVIPNVHPAQRGDSYPRSAVGQAGWHQADTACPIAAGTWESAYWSAQTAIAAADAVAADTLAGPAAGAGAGVQGGVQPVYALCRPPGHHAFADLAGGFCFLNNAAIAAQRLLSHGLRVAILDVDVHHGNGTQGVFYKRSDVLTVSIHADPVRFYPFFWGHAHERGAGPGLGANLNLPLPRGTDDAGFLDALATALRRIASHAADIIVISLGLDAHEHDPFQGLAVSTGGFERIGAAIAALGLPLVLVQEGGYVSDALGQNLTAFLGGVQQ